MEDYKEAKEDPAELFMNIAILVTDMREVSLSILKDIYDAQFAGVCSKGKLFDEYFGVDMPLQWIVEQAETQGLCRLIHRPFEGLCAVPYKSGRIVLPISVNGKSANDFSSGSAEGKGNQLLAVIMIVFPKSETYRVIGKQRSVLNQIIEDSGAQVTVSKPDEVIPETGDRIITAKGTLEAVAQVQRSIVSILCTISPNSSSLALKILLSNASVGSIHGHGGLVIKKLVQSTGATIRTLRREDTKSLRASEECIVTINGSQREIDLAQRAIYDHLASAPEFHSKTRSVFV
jgi:hypothetical protein